MWSKHGIGLLYFFSSALTLYAQDKENHIPFKKSESTRGKDTVIKIKGDISVYSTFYHMEGSPYRRSPFSWTYSGNPVLSIKGIEIPARFVLGEQNRYFRQPFNQVGISPRYKWMTLHLGHRNLYFSPFTLGGHTMLGAGMELNPGKWKMAFMYGRLRKAIGEDPLLPYYIQASYKRIGYGGYISYGSKNNLIAISFFRARDDTTSLERNLLNNTTPLSPSDNIVTGIQSKQQFRIKNSSTKLNWEVDWAVSAFNRDYRVRPVSAAKLGLWKPFTGLFQPTHSMRIATAGQTSLTLKLKDLSTKVQYRRIDPDYVSMGSYYFQTDMENITLEPSWKMFRKKLSIQSSLGLQKDNITNQRQSTTKRTIGSINFSFVPNLKYGLDVQLSNYGIAQKAGRNPLNDTIRMVQANKNLSIINRYSIIDQSKAKTVMLMLNYQQVSDLNAFTSSINNSGIFFVNLSYNQVWIPARLSMNTSIQRTLFKSYAGKNSITGVTSSISKTLMDYKMSWTNSTSVFLSSYRPNQVFALNPQKSVIITLFSGAQYKINQTHQLNGNLSCIFNMASANQSFSEITGVLGYTLSL